MNQITAENSITLLENIISPEMKVLWEKAADLQGCSLNDFVIYSVQEASCKVIEQHQILKLTIEESEALAEALLNPPPPKEALKIAINRYQQTIQNNFSIIF
jgi:uncharacterized protein (DUF1778 family)